jgi:flavin-binding protein dodecin
VIITTVVKVVELIGSSTKSWQEAVEKAVGRAAETIRDIKGVDVLGRTAKVENKRIVEYRADIKISFAVEKIGGQ